ncbi:hypothetical protein CDAR_93621 [Caerostris darwini]|uniref:Uncharacterized protein n=1 Tax=Caerostris darwini TaxID=1538125 RepID=A0AAV4SZE5_9ARAC|nr:hypothetical protein CDAR_93621 [Caerostris darwini]
MTGRRANVHPSGDSCAMVEKKPYLDRDSTRRPATIGSSTFEDEAKCWRISGLFHSKRMHIRGKHRTNSKNGLVDPIEVRQPGSQPFSNAGRMSTRRR